MKPTLARDIVLDALMMAVWRLDHDAARHHLFVKLVQFFGFFADNRLERFGAGDVAESDLKWLFHTRFSMVERKISGSINPRNQRFENKRINAVTVSDYPFDARAAC